MNYKTFLVIQTHGRVSLLIVILYWLFSYFVQCHASMSWNRRFCAEITCSSRTTEFTPLLETNDWLCCWWKIWIEMILRLACANQGILMLCSTKVHKGCTSQDSLRWYSIWKSFSSEALYVCLLLWERGKSTVVLHVQW